MPRPPMPHEAATLAPNRRAFLTTAMIGSAAATLAPLYPALDTAREVAPTLEA